MMENKKILVIIPAYNEEDTIAKVIEGTKKSFPFIDILVVSDGSSDTTSAIAKERQAYVLDLPKYMNKQYENVVGNY